ncbi:hypothetical protein JW960_11575 [candidate division KSB1 bacterium]|nr:hypothetical protein [candidate division KSB1 bacterium]
MKIKMELLSDAIPGSGEGLAGIIDGDINYDEFGIPYIPAKRIKGILRESARELEDAGLLENSNIVNELFGEIGQKNGTAFKLSDGYVDDYNTIRQFLKSGSQSIELKKIFNREAILGHYSYTRSQTTINDNGVAEKDSLRTFRILKKGQSFNFEIDFPDGDKADFTNILHVTRLFGTSRTRGTGEIRLSLSETRSSSDASIGEESSELQMDDNDECSITLHIHNISQLLVSSQVGKTQESEDFIPGSFILGAFANKFISKCCNGNPPHENDDFKAIFLHGNIRFSNAYPCIEEKKSLFPVPLSIVKEKDKNNYFDLSDPKNIKKITDQKIQTKGRIGDFVEIQGNETILSKSTATEMEYHHWRPYDRSKGHPIKIVENNTEKKEGDFFQFKVISADQHFTSSITGKYCYLKKITSLFNDRDVIYLGKSKTAQYGKCKLETITCGKLDESKREWKNGTEAVITLISDTILRNENGLNVADPALLLKEILNALGFPEDSKAIEFKRAFVDVKKVGGYLGVWNMPKMQHIALAAGSEIICKNNTGKAQSFRTLENHTYGCRTEEGFGRIKLDWHNKMKAIKFDDAKITYVIPDDLSPIIKLAEHILNRELETTVIKYAITQFEKFKARRDKISNSFIGRLKLLVNHSDTPDKLNENIRFSKQAFDQLAKLEKFWLLERKKENKKQIYVLNLNNFATKLMNNHAPAHIPELRTRMQELMIAEDTIKTDTKKQYKMFQLFANHFLTLARLHNREEE